jgi:hypothetical protein
MKLGLQGVKQEARPSHAPSGKQCAIVRSSERLIPCDYASRSVHGSSQRLHLTETMLMRFADGKSLRALLEYDLQSTSQIA